MEKIKLDWKAPSEAKMIEFVSGLEDEQKKQFASACIVEVEGEAPKLVKSKAKNWLADNFDEVKENGEPVIEWVNRPVKKEKKLTNAELVASWLKL